MASNPTRYSGSVAVPDHTPILPPVTPTFSEGNVLFPDDNPGGDGGTWLGPPNFSGNPASGGTNYTSGGLPGSGSGGGYVPPGGGGYDPWAHGPGTRDATVVTKPKTLQQIQIENAIDAQGKFNDAITFLAGFTGTGEGPDVFTNIVNGFNALLNILGAIKGIKFTGGQKNADGSDVVDNANEMEVDHDSVAVLQDIRRVGGYKKDIADMIKQVIDGTLLPPAGMSGNEFVQDLRNIESKLVWIGQQLDILYWKIEHGG